MELTNKVAVITGGGSGVGRATALALAQLGMSVGLIGRRRGNLEETARIVEALGRRAIVAPADVGNESETTDAIAKVVSELGGIDALVCAAAIERDGPVSGFELADWEATFSANLTGVFLCCREALPYLEKSHGAAIAIGSGAGKQGYANLSAYSASKFGLIGFMQSLAAEVGPKGVKVSTILPGSIMTGFGGRAIAEKEEMRAKGRKYIEPEDVAEAVAYLLSQSDRAWTQELNLWPF